MKTIKAKVHRLPTEDKSNIAYNTQYNSLWIADEYTQSEIERGVEKLSYQHLYITIDEEIKEGDWYLDIEIKRIYQCVFSKEKTSINRDFNCFRKIIATTDSKLCIGHKDDYDPRSKTGGKPIFLPQPPKSFIKEYCKAGGIDEVLVEYETLPYIDKVEVRTVDRLKLNPDNTIIIHPVEEKMYNRDEVGSKIKEFVKEYAYEWSMDDINEWIEENL